MNTKAIGAASQVIFKAMTRNGVVPATIAVALDANGLLAGPDAAVETTALRARLAELESVLAERDEQIAYLLADEPTLDDDQPGVPA
ncbi:hypothetical protein [Streptomyces goshikiensis]|uniref:hypothetical protein n=1 Tax=Streptomyces goshikiensis TaxID=1942 RepID=UPI002E146C44|nr:hypothetical protein OG224_06920 [Streptomyces goshikiensis]